MVVPVIIGADTAFAAYRFPLICIPAPPTIGTWFTPMTDCVPKNDRTFRVVAFAVVAVAFSAVRAFDAYTFPAI